MALPVGLLAQPQFQAPMDIPLVLSGNFMEIRSDHFHSGIDIKTQGREGIPVRSVAAGWVSRIKVSPWGYGHALYIDHGNGYTSVYGHLSAYKGAIAAATLKAQYKARSFAIDIYPEKGELPVAQGAVIALSGNSGGSGGPHLHFEIRRNSDQFALDPESLGIDIRDNIPPTIRGVRLHGLAPDSRVSPYPGNAVGFATQGSNGKYALKPGNTIAALGPVGFSVHTVDTYNDSHNTCGVRRIRVLVDSAVVQTVSLAAVDWDKQRYCNAHAEYALFKKDNMHYHRCYRMPGDQLDIYGDEMEGGRFTPEPGKVHQVRVEVTDANGNLSTLEFPLSGATSEEAARWPGPAPLVDPLRWNALSTLARPGVRLTVPAGGLYEDVSQEYRQLPARTGMLSPIHVLQDPLTPLHKRATLAIEVGELPAGVRTKAVIVKVEGSKVSSEGGTYADGWITTEVKRFGAFSVQLDTVPPRIVPVDLRSDMRGRQDLTVRIGDDLSGVDSYSATLDGQWIMMAYEPKRGTLTHTFDAHSEGTGQRELVLTVVDERGNSNVLKQTFQR